MLKGQFTTSRTSHGDYFSFLYFPLPNVHGLWVLFRHYRSYLRIMFRVTFSKEIFTLFDFKSMKTLKP